MRQRYIRYVPPKVSVLPNARGVPGMYGTPERVPTSMISFGGPGAFPKATRKSLEPYLYMNVFVVIRKKFVYGALISSI
jgi:hypothetical protein